MARKKRTSNPASGKVLTPSAMMRDELTRLEKEHRERTAKLNNYGGEKSIADLHEVLNRTLPDAVERAVETRNPALMFQAIHDANLISMAKRKAREEFDWKQHAIRADEQVQRERGGKLSVDERAKRVAEILKEKRIYPRGSSNPLSAGTIKREVLRSARRKK